MECEVSFYDGATAAHGTCRHANGLIEVARTSGLVQTFPDASLLLKGNVLAVLRRKDASSPLAVVEAFGPGAWSAVADTCARCGRSRTHKAGETMPRHSKDLAESEHEAA
jgi:hypothetical protein